MNKTELERNLKYTKKKHEHDKLNTFDTDISMLCFDTLNVLNNCNVSTFTHILSSRICYE